MTEGQSSCSCACRVARGGEHRSESEGHSARVQLAEAWDEGLAFYGALDDRSQAADSLLQEGVEFLDDDHLLYLGDEVSREGFGEGESHAQLEIGGGVSQHLAGVLIGYAAGYDAKPA